MIKYIIQMINKYSGEVLDTEDEEFDTYEDAKNYSLECSLNYSEGAEVLEDAGRSFDDPDDVDFVGRRGRKIIYYLNALIVIISLNIGIDTV